MCSLARPGRSATLISSLSLQQNLDDSRYDDTRGLYDPIVSPVQFSYNLTYPLNNEHGRNF